MGSKELPEEVHFHRSAARPGLRFGAARAGAARVPGNVGPGMSFACLGLERTFWPWFRVLACVLWEMRRVSGVTRLRQDSQSAGDGRPRAD